MFPIYDKKRPLGEPYGLERSEWSFSCGRAKVGRITKDEHDKKLQELKDKQYRLYIELDEYTKADHEYHIHVSTVLNLCRRMKDVFESSEPNEKRAILNFLLQNPTVSGKKLAFTLKKPFDTVLELAYHPTPLPG